MLAAEKIQDWAVLPYNTERINGHYLVTNSLGNWDLLVPDEFKRLEKFSFSKKDALFDRLYDKGIIVREENVTKLISEYRNLQSHLFSDTRLHIAVVTTRCNIACHYCQANTKEPQDMSLEVAAQLIKYLFDVRSPSISLEFQGGEPLLNWTVVKALTQTVRESSASKKNINISLVTNGILLNKEKIDFLIDHNVDICISLDGPQHLHDSNRTSGEGKGTYKQVTAAIQRLMDAYKQRSIEKPINLLSTFTKHNLLHVKDVIDEYLKWGVQQIAIRSTSKIGAAKNHWGKLGYSPEEFTACWAEAMDYLLELNVKGVNARERMAIVLLKKILKKEDPGYVDLMSPCGAGRSVLTYNPNGDVYPCDEARMIGSDIFKLGNVLKDSYEDIMKSPNLFSICKSSVIDLWDYNDAYSPWIGTCPVLNYSSQGNIVPKITQTPLHKIKHFQFEYLFKKMIENDKYKEIFERWAK